MFQNWSFNSMNFILCHLTCLTMFNIHSCIVVYSWYWAFIFLFSIQCLVLHGKTNCVWVQIDQGDFRMFSARNMRKPQWSMHKTLLCHQTKSCKSPLSMKIAPYKIGNRYQTDRRNSRFYSPLHHVHNLYITVIDWWVEMKVHVARVITPPKCWTAVFSFYTSLAQWREK